MQVAEALLPPGVIAFQPAARCGVPVVELRRDGQEPGPGQVVGYPADVRVHPEQLVRHDHADGCRVRRGPGQIRGPARELFADWAAGSPGERNLVRWMFTTDQAREVYLEWEPEARAMLGRFRLSAARYPDDPDVRALIAELQRDSEHVRDWWPRHDVAAIGGSGSKKLRHPRLGPAEYSHVVLQVADQPDQTLVTYSPATPLESGR